MTIEWIIVIWCAVSFVVIKALPEQKWAVYSTVAPTEDKVIILKRGIPVAEMKPEDFWEMPMRDFREFAAGEFDVLYMPSRDNLEEKP